MNEPINDLALCLRYTNVWDSPTIPAGRCTSIVDSIEKNQFVILLSRKGNFDLKIVTPNGLIGWVDKDNFKIIT